MQKFEVPLLIITQNRKQPKCPSTGEWINKLVCSQNGILLSHKKEWPTATWDVTELRKQHAELKSRVIPFIGNSKRGKTSVWWKKIRTACCLWDRSEVGIHRYMRDHSPSDRILFVHCILCKLYLRGKKMHKYWTLRGSALRKVSKRKTEEGGINRYLIKEV